MINFSTLQGLTIPEGVVTQITDASGRVLWMAQSESEPAVLQVAKITSNTYAGSTEYANENFVLLDIYPKTNGTVKVTYGGLTKTITDTSGAAEPNAQQVFFGTFNGVSDSVTTPTSGTLTIEGNYYAYGIGTYKTLNSTTNKSSNEYCRCITSVTEWGSITSVPNYAFYECSLFTAGELPYGVTSIGDYAFYGCIPLAITKLPDGVTSIGNYAFSGCMSINDFTLPASIASIGTMAFAVYDTKSDTETNMVGNVYILAAVPFDIGDPFDTCTFGYPGGGTYGDIKESIFGAKQGQRLSLIVPKGCGEAYKTDDYWIAYKNCIVEAS